MTCDRGGGEGELFKKNKRQKLSDDERKAASVADQEKKVAPRCVKGMIINRRSRFRLGQVRKRIDGSVIVVVFLTDPLLLLPRTRSCFLLLVATEPLLRFSRNPLICFRSFGGGGGGSSSALRLLLLLLCCCCRPLSISDSSDIGFGGGSGGA